MSDHSRVLTATGADCYLVALLEQVALCDSLVHFFLELSEETLLTDCLEVARPLDQGFVGVATFA
jgi:hypothetical protein